MERADLDSVLAQLFDRELLFHGFTPYMRDYELVVYESVDPNPKYGLVPRHLRFLFRYCTEAAVHSRVRPDVWARSFSDDLLASRHVSRESTGYVWGVEAQEIYPGATAVQDSERARYWTDQVGIAFHEVHIEANAQTIALVFAEVTVEQVASGYTPFSVAAAGHAEAYASGSRHPLTSPEEQSASGLAPKQVDLSFLRPDLQALAVHTGTGEVMWPRSYAQEVINEISAAGFVILGLDLRSDGGGTTPAGLSTEISWSSYRRNSERGTASIDAARQQATEALRRPDLTEFEGYQWVLVTWTSA